MKFCGGGEVMKKVERLLAMVGIMSILDLVYMVLEKYFALGISTVGTKIITLVILGVFWILIENSESKRKLK